VLRPILLPGGTAVFRLSQSPTAYHPIVLGSVAFEAG